MKTVGEILKDARLKKGIGLEQVASVTKIKKDYLLALENNQFGQLSSGVVARGFIKNYAEFLGLASESILAVFKRDFIDRKREKIILLKPGFQWTPQVTLIAVIVLFVILLVAYLGWQYFSLVNAPYH